MLKKILIGLMLLFSFNLTNATITDLGFDSYYNSVYQNDKLYYISVPDGSLKTYDINTDTHTDLSLGTNIRSISHIDENTILVYFFDKAVIYNTSTNSVDRTDNIYNETGFAGSPFYDLANNKLYFTITSTPESGADFGFKDLTTGQYSVYTHQNCERPQSNVPVFVVGSIAYYQQAYSPYKLVACDFANDVGTALNTIYGVHYKKYAGDDNIFYFDISNQDDLYSYNLNTGLETLVTNIPTGQGTFEYSPVGLFYRTSQATTMLDDSIISDLNNPNTGVGYDPDVNSGVIFGDNSNGISCNPGLLLSIDKIDNTKINVYDHSYNSLGSFSFSGYTFDKISNIQGGKVVVNDGLNLLYLDLANVYGSTASAIVVEEIRSLHDFTNIGVRDFYEMYFNEDLTLFFVGEEGLMKLDFATDIIEILYSGIIYGGITYNNGIIYFNKDYLGTGFEGAKLTGYHIANGYLVQKTDNYSFGLDNYEGSNAGYIYSFGNVIYNKHYIGGIDGENGDIIYTNSLSAINELCVLDDNTLYYDTFNGEIVKVNLINGLNTVAPEFSFFMTSIDFTAKGFILNDFAPTPNGGRLDVIIKDPLGNVKVGKSLYSNSYGIGSRIEVFFPEHTEVGLHGMKLAYYYGGNIYEIGTNFEVDVDGYVPYTISSIDTDSGEFDDLEFLTFGDVFNESVNNGFTPLPEYKSFCTSFDEVDGFLLGVSNFFDCVKDFVVSSVDNIFLLIQKIKEFFASFGNIGVTDVRKDFGTDYTSYFDFSFFKTASASDTYIYNESQDPLAIISQGNFNDIPILNNIYYFLKYFIIFGLFVGTIFYFFKVERND